jgi:ribosomal protein S8
MTPLSDMLTRIRNGQQAAKPVDRVCLFRACMRMSVTVLKDEGFIREYRTERKTARKTC